MRDYTDRNRTRVRGRSRARKHVARANTNKLFRQMTCLSMSCIILFVTVFGNATISFANKRDDNINRIIEQYENGEISRAEARRALTRNGVTSSPIFDLDEDEDGNAIASESDIARKLGEADRIIDEQIESAIEGTRDSLSSLVFAWHHESVDKIIDEISDPATKSFLTAEEVASQSQIDRAEDDKLPAKLEKILEGAAKIASSSEIKESENDEDETVDNSDAIETLAADGTVYKSEEISSAAETDDSVSSVTESTETEATEDTKETESTDTSDLENTETFSASTDDSETTADINTESSETESYADVSETAEESGVSDANAEETENSSSTDETQSTSDTIVTDSEIDITEYMTVSSAVKKYHDEWIESDSFDSGNKIGLTLNFSIPEGVMYDDDTRTAVYPLPDGLSSIYKANGEVQSGDNSIGTFKVEKNKITITFDKKFVKSGRAIEGVLFFKALVENKTDDDCLTIELGGTAGSLDVYKEVKQSVVSDDGKVKVTATYGASTFDGDVTLHAEALSESDEAEAKVAFEGKLQKENLIINNMYLYDVFFMDESGDKIEPDGHVSVKMAFNKALNSDGNDNLKIYHVKNDDLNEIEDLTSMDDTVINENSNGEVHDVELVTDSFSTFATIEGATCLNNYLESVTIKNAELSDTDKNTYIVKDGVTYTFKLTFSDDKANKKSFPFEKVNGEIPWMYYEIPDGLYIENKETEFSVRLNDNKIIDGNKLVIKVIDGKKYLALQWNDQSPYFDELKTSSIRIYAQMTGSISKNARVIKFSDDLEKTIEFDDTKDLTVQKTGYYDSNNKEINYKITITSKGVSNNIKVTDTLGSALKLQPTFTVKSNVRDSVNETINNKSDGGFEMTIPTMTDGEIVTIQYKASVLFDKIKESNNAEFTETGNTVKVNDKEDTHPETYINFSDLKKYCTTASIDGTNSYKDIAWVIEANSQQLTNISYIKDTIDNAAVEYMSYSGEGITVEITDAKGNAKKPFIIKWADLNCQKNDDGEFYSWTLDNLNGYGRSKYKITYTTRVDLNRLKNEKAKGGQTPASLKNDAETNKKHTYAETPVEEQNTTPTSNIDLKKSAIDVTPERIKWKISITIPKDYECPELVVRDEPQVIWIGEENNKRAISDKILEDSITVEGLVGDESYEAEIFTYNNNLKDSGYKFTFYKDKEHKKEGLNKSSKAERVITFFLETENNKEWMDYADQHKGNGWLLQHSNTASVNDKTSTATAVITSKKITKNGSYECDNKNSEDYVVLKYELILSSIQNDHITIYDHYDKNITTLKELYTNPYNNNFSPFIYSGNQYYQGSNQTAITKADDSDSSTQNTYSIDSKNNVITFHINNLPKDADGKFYSHYKICYSIGVPMEDAHKLAIDNDGKYQFNNSAKWDGLTSDCDVEYEHNPLNKKGFFNEETGLLEYTITINEGAETINNNESMDLEDEYDDQVIDIDSINVYTYDNNQNETKISPQLDIYDNKIIFKNLPDNRKIKITYKSRPIFNGNSEKTLKVHNAVRLISFFDETYTEATFDAELYAIAFTPKIQISKRNEDKSKALKNAEFTIYEVDSNTKELDKESAKTFKTDENGMITITSNDYQKLCFKKMFCLVETKAPNGYTKSDEKYYFTINDPHDNAEYHIDAEEHVLPNGYVLTITNNKSAGLALPITGGIGVNMIYLIGSLMVVLGGFILIIMRKRDLL